MKLSDFSTSQIAALQSRANRALKTKMAYFLRDYGLTPMQWTVIGVVNTASGQGIRISDIAAELGTSMAFATTTVNALEGKGIMQKTGHSNDNRAKLVHLTPQFSLRFDGIEQALHGQLTTWLRQRLPVIKINAYCAAINSIAKTAG